MPPSRPIHFFVDVIARGMSTTKLTTPAMKLRYRAIPLVGHTWKLNCSVGEQVTRVREDEPVVFGSIPCSQNLKRWRLSDSSVLIDYRLVIEEFLADLAVSAGSIRSFFALGTFMHRMEFVAAPAAPRWIYMRPLGFCKTFTPEDRCEGEEGRQNTWRASSDRRPREGSRTSWAR
jgi:hypothetical protein